MFYLGNSYGWGRVLGTTHALDAATDGLGVIFKADKTGSITDLGFWCASVTGSSPTYDWRLETVNTSSQPSNTLAVANSNITGTIAAGFAWKTLTAAYSCTVNQSLAAALRVISGADGSNFATMNPGLAGANAQVNGNNNHPFYLTLTAGTWAAVNGFPFFGVKYSDGSVQIGSLAISAITETAFNSGSATNRRGISFVAPVDCYCNGCVFYTRFQATTANFAINLYDNATQLATATFAGNTDVRGTGAANVMPLYAFWAAQRLTRGRTYRIAVVPSTVNNINVLQFDFVDSAARQAFVGEIQSTSFASGSFTDLNTSAVAIAPLITFSDYIIGRRPIPRQYNV